MEEVRGSAVSSIPGESTSEGVTPLMYACQQGRDHTVRQILHRKPTSVRERDRTGKTALHYCAENQTLSCIDQVVEADPALLQARDEDGYTPLHLATIAGNKSVVKYLLTKGADVQALDNEKHTVIHWATVCGEVELLDILVEAGADPSTPDIHGAYPLHYAAQMCGPNSEMGNDVRVGLLVLRKLLQHGVDVSVTDHDGRQPLLWAASAGNHFENRSNMMTGSQDSSGRGKYLSGSADAILALVNAGASVSAEDKDGLTALHCAASRGHLDCLDCLLSLCGAEVDTLDSNGCTPLFYAVTLGHADCTQLLLHHAAHPDRQDRKGRTPAHCGAAKGQLETLKLLHQKGADLWKRNVKGDLPLHEACQSGRKDLVMWLLSMRPETVNAPNLDGRCPLHIAAINNNIEMCKILMDQQAAVNPIMRNSRGQLLTPLDAAVARSNRGCAKYLQLHGGVTASKLTDKHALQKAMQRALETSQHGSTGATPTDYTENELMSSSASSALKSTRSTMTASPINTEAQTDTGDLQKDSKDSEDKKSDKPEQRDAQTGTSEVNIRKLVLDEEAELARKKAEEQTINEEKGEDLKKEEAEIQNGNAEQAEEGSMDVDSQNASGKENSANPEGQEDLENGEKKDEIENNKKDEVENSKKDEVEKSERKKVASSKSKDEVDVKEVEEEEGGEGREVRVNEEGEVVEEEIIKSVRDPANQSNYAEIPEHLEVGDPGENDPEVVANVKTDNTGEEAQEGKSSEKKARKSKKNRKTSKAPGENGQAEADDEDMEEERAKPKKIRQASREQGASSQEDEGEGEDGEDVSSVSKSKSKKGTVGKDRKNIKSKGGSEEEAENEGPGHATKEGRGKSRRRKGKKSKILEKGNTVLIGDGGEGEGEEMEISENGEVIIRAGGNENGDINYEDNDSENEDEFYENMEYSEGERSGEDEEMEQSDGDHVDGEHGKQSSDGAGPRGRPKSAIQPGMGKGQGRQSQRGSNSKKSSSTNGGKGKLRNKSKGQKNKGKLKAGSDDNAPGTRRVSISDRPSEEYDPNTTESDVPGKPPSSVGDERTHELMLESSGRDFLMVNDAAPARLSSPSSTHGRDTGDSGFKESGFSDYVGPEQDSDVDGPTDPERHTDDENVQHPTKRKTKSRRLRNKQREERLVGAKSEDAEERSRRKTAGSGNGEDGDDEKPSRRKRDSRNRSRTGSDEGDEGGGGEEGDSEGMEDEIDDEDEDALRKLGISTHRRPGVRKGQTRSGAMSGGPRKVENMDSNLRRKPRKSTNASTEMSITQAMQTTMRKYALERRLFQQLLELKRLQIRNTRANEHVLIKRMVDAYQKEGNSLGLRGYSGPFNFQNYEKYLYDQLRFLQSSQGTKIPTFRPSDDIEKLSRAIRRAEILELPDPLITPRDPYECNHTTHRCHHAAHAYTGIPCAAYIGHRNQRKKNFSLPRIAGTSNTNGGGTSLASSPGPPGGSSAPSRLSEPIGLRNYDPKKPLTVELQHGQARQQITLPTEILDKSKKYHLTFTIKPSSPTKGSQSPEEGNQVVERSASAPETIDADTLPIEPRPEPHSAPPEGRTEPA